MSKLKDLTEARISAAASIWDQTGENWVDPLINLCIPDGWSPDVSRLQFEGRKPRMHKRSCKYHQAVTCRVAVHCEHGRDVCPECDPCTCN